MWTPELRNIFQEVKQHLINAALLAHSDVNAQMSLQTDASNTALGAVLQQKVDGLLQPLSFLSKKLTPTQRNCSTYDKELLAIFTAIKHFRFMLKGRQFHVLTDYKPLISALKKKAEQMSPRQIRQLSFISEFTTDIRHVAGIDNGVADALSRLDTIAMPVKLDMQEIALEQSNDPDLQQLLQTKTSLTLQKFTLIDTANVIYCETSTEEIRPYIPKSLRRRVFDLVHLLSHPSGRSTLQQIAQKFVWPSMSKDVKEWSRTCLASQRSKIHRHNHLPPDKIIVPDTKFEHVHLDIVGPLPPSKGHRFILTMIDRFTRWPEAVSIEDTTVDTVAKTFFTHWISRFGSPRLITTDQGTQFEAQFFSALASLVGTERYRTTAYHPESNGIIERWHRSLKTALTCHGSENWIDVLPVA